MKSSVINIPPFLLNTTYIPRILVILLSALSILIATSQHGIGYGTDAVQYLGGADALMTDGVRASHFGIIFFPPLLSFTLALLGKNLTLILLMNVFLLVTCLALMTWMMTIVDIDEPFIVSTVWMVGVSSPLLFLYAEIRAEALYLVLVQAVLILLVKDKIYWAALFASIAPLQRYSGVVLIGVGIIFIFYKYDWKKALIFGVVTILPIFLWRIRNSLVTNSGQEIAFHPIPLTNIIDGIELLGTWFLPVGLMIAIMLFFNRRIRYQLPVLIWLLIAFICVHLLFYVFSISFIDAFVTLNSRHLSPIFITGWVLVMWVFDKEFKRLRRGYKRIIFIVYFIFVLSLVLLGYVTSIAVSQNGLGLGKVIRPVHYQVMDSIPNTMEIYSNHPILVQLLGRNAEGMPLAYHAGTLEENLTYQDEISSLSEKVLGGKSVIIWFEGFDNPQLIKLEELKSMFNFQVYDGMNLFSNVPIILIEGNL